MQDRRNQQFLISSLGTLYRTSLDMFAHHLENIDGEPIQVDELCVDQSFFVIFKSGTGFTRTSAVRIN